MDNKSDFDFDLSYGQFIEREIMYLLTACKAEDELGEKVKFEIKSDRQAHATGNLFFEFLSRGKESGLRTSKADWWVVDVAGFHGEEFNDPRCVIFFHRKTLIEHLRRLWKEGRVRRVEGGDEDTSDAVLVSFQDLFTKR